jgi:hypothetical protein
VYVTQVDSTGYKSNHFTSALTETFICTSGMKVCDASLACSCCAHA